MTLTDNYCISFWLVIILLIGIPTTILSKIVKQTIVEPEQPVVAPYSLEWKPKIPNSK